MIQYRHNILTTKNTGLIHSPVPLSLYLVLIMVLIYPNINILIYQYIKIPNINISKYQILIYPNLNYSIIVPTFPRIPSLAFERFVIIALRPLPANTNESEASILGNDVTGSKCPSSINF